MIHFAISQSSLELGIANWLRIRGESVQGIVSPVTYESVFPETTVPTGTWILSAICTFTPAGRELASQLRTRLVGAGCRVLNDPVRSLRRFDLLTAMHDAGINQFRAVRAADYRGGLKFPVFIRNDARHEGSISGLLHTEAEVRRELFSLRLRGQDIDDLLVVEFRDLSVNGVFRKYSAFRLGDRIVARHAQSSREWMIKSHTGDRTAAAAEAEAQYMRDNPHEELLAPLFEMAGIEYGRMDYGFHNGRIEVWEINTAPTLGRNPAQKERPGDDVYRAIMRPAQKAAHDHLCRALEAIDTGLPATPLPMEFTSDALAAWRLENARRRRRESMVEGLRSVSQVPGIRFAWRTMESVGRQILGTGA